jgi:phenylacetate-CoA ligase
MDARMTDSDPTDQERYPTLSEHGRKMLDFLREHPHAPLYRNRSGNRLTAPDLERVRMLEAEAVATRVAWRPGAQPQWLAPFIAYCYEQVPHYRSRGAPPARLEDVPPISRAELGRDIAQFVPDDAPIDRLINFRTSGTTGHPLLIASHPVVAASYLAFHKKALGRFGIALHNGRGKVGLVLLGFQRNCFTYVSVTPTMDESGLAKINLHPDDWRDAADRARYLDALEAEIYAGDPISYAELLKIPSRWKPRALLCTSMMLLPALRAQLEERFGCPVLDLYSLNEAGPVSVADSAAGGHVLLQPRMHVEILDPSGAPQPPGKSGEITLTGGFNFCLPLLRYRTGDYAALDFDGPEPVLLGLQGRPPVRFRTTRGEWINNIEITQALGRLALPRFSLRQSADGSFFFNHSGAAALDRQIDEALRPLLGAGAALQVSRSAFGEGKLVQYSSELAGALT